MNERGSPRPENRAPTTPEGWSVQELRRSRDEQLATIAQAQAKIADALARVAEYDALLKQWETPEATLTLVEQRKTA